MFCENCGKEISDEVKYCPYCGKPVENTSTEPDLTKEETQPKVNNSSFLANEIIANLKMVGCALAVTLLFALAFYLYHRKDIQPFSEEPFSCYNESMRLGGAENVWERIYAEKIDETLAYKKWNNGLIKSKRNIEQQIQSLNNELSAQHNKWDNNLRTKREGIDQQIESFIINLSIAYDDAELNYMKRHGYGFNNNNYASSILCPEDVLAEADKEAKRKDIPIWIQEQYKKDAEVEAESNEKMMEDAISEERIPAFREDLKEKTEICAGISLCFFILGRYTLKLGKWVSKNKTNEDSK